MIKLSLLEYSALTSFAVFYILAPNGLLGRVKYTVHPKVDGLYSINTNSIFSKKHLLSMSFPHTRRISLWHELYDGNKLIAWSIRPIVIQRI